MTSHKTFHFRIWLTTISGNNLLLHHTSCLLLQYEVMTCLCPYKVNSHGISTREGKFFFYLPATVSLAIYIFIWTLNIEASFCYAIIFL